MQNLRRNQVIKGARLVAGQSVQDFVNDLTNEGVLAVVENGVPVVTTSNKGPAVVAVGDWIIKDRDTVLWATNEQFNEYFVVLP